VDLAGTVPCGLSASAAVLSGGRAKETIAYALDLGPFDAFSVKNIATVNP
jgi:hypothetical protein